MNFTALKFEQHSILKAYAILFGELPAGSMMFLDRRSLKSQWETRARILGRTNSGWSHAPAREDTLDFEELDWAYRSLLEVLGPRDQAMVSSWTCESIEAVNAVLARSRTAPPTRAPLPTRRRAARGSTVAPITPITPMTPVRPGTPVRAPAIISGSTESRGEVLELPQVSIDAPGPRPRTMFGRFLLARGHITLQQLIDAVRWQRAQRPPVGRIAMSWGILSAKQVYEVLSDKDPEDRFCDVAVRKGYMTVVQRLAVLGRQREMQKPIGTYFVEQGILTRDEIEGLAAEAQTK